MKLKYLLIAVVMLSLLFLTACPSKEAPVPQQPAAPAGEAPEAPAAPSEAPEVPSEEGMAQKETPSDGGIEAPADAKEVEIVKERAGRDYALYTTEDLPDPTVEDIVRDVKCDFDTLTLSFRITNIDDNKKYLGRVLTFGNTDEAFKVSVNGNRIRDLSESCGDAEWIEAGQTLSCVKTFEKTEAVDDYKMRGAGTTYEGFFGITNFNRINGRAMVNSAVSSDEDYFRCPEAGYAPAQAVFNTREEALQARYDEEAKIQPIE
ncbi:hypothetical protein J4410_02570 [Candidatus Woesearchaeota archaeon]|nr:hypothetical protein [Candidatus Woesearchaeota archaeon]